jgi:CRISPR/Cas system endoribonuclease Cas6 (RAMP superfamily)
VNPPSNLQNVWVKVDVNVIALFGAPNQVKLRFRASDLSTPSLVEAAVDDLVVLAASGTTGVEEPASSAPVRFTVGPSQPNPFNPSTTLTYTLPARTEVSVTVYDAAGRVVRELSRKVETAGEHAISWDGRDTAGATVSSGVYHIRVEAAGQAGTQKIVLLK